MIGLVSELKIKIGKDQNEKDNWKNWNWNFD